MNSASLTFYDTSRVYYSSYYLNGFNELKNTRKLKISISNLLPRQLNAAIRNPEWQHSLFAMALFKYQQDNKEWYFCIDTHDANSVNAANHTGGYHLPLLHSVDVYFKVNYNPNEIAQTPELKIFQEKICSISQFFPLRPTSLLPLSRRLLLPPTLFGFRPSIDYTYPNFDYLLDAKHRLRDLNNFQSLEEITAYRKTCKDIDIFFVTSFRHNPNYEARHEATMERRYQVMKKLSCIPTLNNAIGFSSSSSKTPPDKFAKIAHRRLSQSDYLETLARAKVVIYTQGIKGCISSKFGLAMALGIAVIGEPLMNNPELLTTHPHLREQFRYTDPDELVEHAIDLAIHPEKAREIGALNAATFDNYLAPRPTAQYVLNTLFKFQGRSVSTAHIID